MLKVSTYPTPIAVARHQDTFLLVYFHNQSSNHPQPHHRHPHDTPSSYHQSGKLHIYHRHHQMDKGKQLQH